MSSFPTIPASTPIRVVQVGCGKMAQGWVQRTIARKDLALVGLVDVRREAAVETAAKHSLPASVVYGSLEEAIAKTSPHAVFDITVPAAHHQITMSALKAGCHVLGEKPISDELAHAREMCAAADAAGRLYMVTQNRRYRSEIIAFSEALRAGTVGGLSSLDSDFFLGAHFGGFREEMQHVLLLDMAIHTFDAARFISGRDPVTAYCHEYNPKGSWYRHGAAAICIFEMQDGVVYTYRGSWTAEGYNTPWESSWRAVGDRGSIVWDGNTDPRAQLRAGEEGFTRPVKDVALPTRPCAKPSHDGVLDEFVCSLRSGALPQTHCRDNIKSLAMCYAAIESARTGSRVPVTW